MLSLHKPLSHNIFFQLSEEILNSSIFRSSSEITKISAQMFIEHALIFKTLRPSVILYPVYIFVVQW